MDATIVIPVKNGGKRFDEVLTMIESQETKYTHEVIVIDSGSSDTSIEIAKKHHCRLYQILPKEFGHGRTRNLGASYGTGRYIVFLTQDALPVNTCWLDELINAMEEDEEIAGGFGKHLPYPDCNLPDELMLMQHFARFGETTTVFAITKENRTQYETEEAYRQFLAFFSDNNSILRRSVWEKIPYDDVDFAEDQIWAKKILEAGYKKIYVPKAMVYHSHNYPLSSYGKRYYDDFKAIYKVYGTNFCPNFYTFVRKVIGDTKHEWGYVHRKEGLSPKERLYWYGYSLRRNIKRYSAAHNAVKYFSLSQEGKEKMDRRYSQQYLQIRE